MLKRDELSSHEKTWSKLNCILLHERRHSEELHTAWFQLYDICFVCLFIFGCTGTLWLCVGFLLLQRAGSTLCHDVWSSHCGGFSCCRVQALGCSDSAVVVHELSKACEIFLDQGSNPCSLYWQMDSWPLDHRGSPAWHFEKGKTIKTVKRCMVERREE